MSTSLQFPCHFAAVSISVWNIFVSIVLYSKALSKEKEIFIRRKKSGRLKTDGVENDDALNNNRILYLSAVSFVY